MSEHHLTNLRPANTIPDGTPEPRCHHCRFKLHLMPLEGIITRAHGHTYCSEHCYGKYIAAKAAQRVRDHVMPYDDIDRLHALEDALEDVDPPHWEPPRPTAYQIEQREIVDAYRRNAAKSNVRKTAEAGANIIGFCIWLVVISIIATALLAVL